MREVLAAIADNNTMGSRLLDSPFHTQPNPCVSASFAAFTQIFEGIWAAELNSVSMIMFDVVLSA